MIPDRPSSRIPQPPGRRLSDPGSPGGLFQRGPRARRVGAVSRRPGGPLGRSGPSRRARILYRVQAGGRDLQRAFRDTPHRRPGGRSLPSDLDPPADPRAPNRDRPQPYNRGCAHASPGASEPGFLCHSRRSGAMGLAAVARDPDRHRRPDSTPVGTQQEFEKAWPRPKPGASRAAGQRRRTTISMLMPTSSFTLRWPRCGRGRRTFRPSMPSIPSRS